MGEALFMEHGRFTKHYITGNQVTPSLSNYQQLVDSQGREMPCEPLLTYDIMLTGPILSRCYISNHNG